MKARTYVAPGLLDFTLMLKAGKAWTTVEFSGGRSSGYGNFWARFTTDDEVIAHMIENSPEFRKGKVRLERS